jgi:chlorite dismutase
MPDPSSRYFCFTFYSFDPGWRRLPAAARRSAILEFLAAVERHRDRVEMRAYSTVGLKRDCEFGTWAIAPSAEALNDLGADLVNTELWGYLRTPYQFLSLTKPSPYANTAEDKTPTPQGEKTWLFVYPFVKTKAWYQQPLEARSGMMREHIALGRAFPDIRINTSYSFGIDDQEFVVAFEGDDPVEFVKLVEKLRSSRATAYTERDTPMFTCRRMGLKEALERVSFSAAEARPVG